MTSQSNPRPPTDIAVLLPHLNTGGAEISMLRLARGFAQRGLKVDIVATRGMGSLRPFHEGDLFRLGCEKATTLTTFPSLVRYVRSARPRVLLAGQPHLNIAAVSAAALARSGARPVLIEHAPLDVQVRFENGWRYRSLPLLIPALYRPAEAVVAVSEGVREQLQRLLPGKDVALIRNPILPENLAELTAAPVDHPWFQDGGPPVVISVGRLAREKDFPALVHAVAQLGERRPLRLMILGEGPERPRILAEAAGAGFADRLALPGNVANVFAYLKRARVFALSSRFEGFGNVLIEALACGLPVVSTDCPVGPREALGEGRYGRLVPPGDVEALARAIGEALDPGPRPAGLEAYIDHYTIEASVEQYLELLSDRPVATASRLQAQERLMRQALRAAQPLRPLERR